MRDVWEAMSDKTRREILVMLKERNLSAGEIAEKFSLTKATVSHHLSCLLYTSRRQSQKQRDELCRKVLRVGRIQDVPYKRKGVRTGFCGHHVCGYRDACDSERFSHLDEIFEIQPEKYGVKQPQHGQRQPQKRKIGVHAHEIFLLERAL